MTLNLGRGATLPSPAPPVTRGLNRNFNWPGVGPVHYHFMEVVPREIA